MLQSEHDRVFSMQVPTSQRDPRNEETSCLYLLECFVTIVDFRVIFLNITYIPCPKLRCWVFLMTEQQNSSQYDDRYNKKYVSSPCPLDLMLRHVLEWQYRLEVPMLVPVCVYVRVRSVSVS